MLKGAIFDFDGTLFDSMFIWDTAGEVYLQSIGIEPRENLQKGQAVLLVRLQERKLLLSERTWEIARIYNFIMIKEKDFLKVKKKSFFIDICL